MKNKMQKFSSFWPLVLLFFLWAGLPVYAQRGASQTDQMLKRTLTELRKRMLTASEINSKLLKKNNAIRKRVLFLEEQTRKFKNRKGSFPKSPVAYRNQGKTPRSGIQKIIQKSQRKQDRMRRAVADLRREIDELQHKNKGARKAFGEWRENEGKDSLKKKLSQKRRRSRVKEKKVSMLRKKISRPMREKKNFQKRQNILMERLRQVQNELEVASDEKQQLSDSIGVFRDQKEDKITVIQKEILGLQQYCKKAENTLQRFEDVHELIVSQFRAHNEKMVEFIKFLKEEKKLLLEKVKIAEYSMKLIEDLKKKLRKKISLADEIEEELGGRVERLDDQHQMMEQQIHRGQDKINYLKENIDKGKDEINKVFLSHRKYKRKKLYLSQMLKESQQIVRRVKGKARLAEKKFVSTKNKMEEHFSKRDSLIEGLRRRQRDLRAASDKNYELDESVGDLRSQRTKNVLLAREEIAQLKLYQARLGEAIDKFQNVHKSTISQFSSHQKEMDESQRFLEKENELLVKKVGSLERSVSTHKDLMDVIKSKASLKIANRDLRAGGERLIGMREEIVKRIDANKKTRRILNEKKMNFASEIRQLENKAQFARRKAGSVKKNVLSKPYADLSKKLKEYTQRNQETQVKLISIKKDVEYASKELWRAQERQNYLNQHLRMAQTSLRHLLTQKSSILRKYAQNVGGALEKKTQKLKEEIEALKMRHTVLADSLSVIMSKYNVKNLDIGMSKKEEKELNKYLVLLREENEGLRAEISSMTSSLKRLDIRRADLGRRRTRYP